VSGLLIILFGKTRKVSDLISKFDKEYICEMQLHDFVSESKIIEVFNKFIGDIYQKPPLRAAVKKSPRIRRIYSIEVLDIVKRNILFKAKVQAGTYIRKLCFDIGEILGCGAHMTELRRTKIGPFSEDDERVATLHELVGAYKEWKNNKNEKYLRAFTLPIEELLDFLPKIYIKDTAIFSITHGSYVAAPGVIAATNDLKMNSYVTINTERNEIIAIGISTVDLSKLQKMDKGMVAKIDKVISFTQTAGSGI
jgi:H/ACA ribonucleoprotein complex subunit 4